MTKWEIIPSCVAVATLAALLAFLDFSDGRSLQDCARRLLSEKMQKLPNWALFACLLVTTLSGYVTLCVIARVLIMRAVSIPKTSSKLSWEMNLMRSMQGGGSIRIAGFCRYLVTDEAIFIVIPILVWTFQERMMFLPFAVTINELANGMMKWCVQRPRPYWIEKDIVNPIQQEEVDFSFPSSHAQISASFATALVIEFGLNFVTGPVVAMVMVVAISRVVLGVHYPTCVGAGASLGVTLTLGLKGSGILEWYTEDITEKEQFVFIVITVLALSLTFELVRLTVKEDKSLVSLYASRFSKDVPLQEVRSLDKYSFQLLCLLGSGIGVMLMVHDNMSLRLKFPVANLIWMEIVESKHLWKRVFLLGCPGMVLLFALVFLVPSKLNQTRRTRLASFSKILGSFLFGVWVTYGCPKCAWWLDWEDPLLACPPSRPFSKVDAPSSNWSYVDYNLQPRTNACNLRPFNHTAANPRCQVVSLEISSIEELQDAIVQAKTTGKVLRIVGAGWSTQAHFSESDHTIYASLVGPHFQGYRKVEQPSGRGPLVVAGAGIFLGGQQWLSDTGAPESLNVKWEDSLLHKLWKDGLALPSIPDAIGMTLGGLLSTGSDGWAFGDDELDDARGSLRPYKERHSLSSAVMGFRYVDGTGELRDAWRNSTENEDFRAFGVSFGLAGVMYEVILAPVGAYCVELESSSTTSSVHPKPDRSTWHGLLRTGIDKYDMLDKVRKRVVPPSGFTETGEVLCGNKPPLGFLGCSNDNDTALLLFGHPYSTIEADFAIWLVALSYRWFSQESCQSQQDICLDDTVQKYLQRNDKAFSASLGRQHYDLIEGCARALVEQKRLKASGKRPTWQKDWWDKNTIVECYGKVFDNFGWGKKKMGNFRYYETAFLHRMVDFHSYHIMEVYFPLEGNSLNAQEILRKLQEIYDVVGHEVGWTADYYFSHTNDDFWMAPEGARVSTSNETKTAESTGVFRVNIYLDWTRDNMHSVFDIFLDRFDDLGLTYALNWAKVLPSKASRMQRVLQNFPHYEEWRSFILARDPGGVFRSDYWDQIFFTPSHTGNTLSRPIDVLS